MSVLIWMIPVAIAMGALGLAGFLWSLRSGQYDDMDGAAQRMLLDDDAPLPSRDSPAGRPRSDDAETGQDPEP
ncbi:cbb3-type cytochrome oxidase assembly protein CcoS [Maricaulis sp.]|uniref:cbb3-type cytochrome oxidase assembly protein CcoS n=1 Tax=Maricaulis sp. TaxID=1486257 RepID=UPI002B2657D6|nr:cbb3-type cytochrome oxidase assembly protein CcoS [Maricaulis sp.]